MLARKLCSILPRRMCMCLSTLPQQKPDVVQPGDTRSSTNIVSESKIPNVLDYPDYFDVASMFTIKDLFDAKVHYGHKISSVNPNMGKFLFGSRLGHSIFNLDETAFHLKEALNFTAHIAYRDGIILFVSRNPRATLLVENTAQDCSEFAIAREWSMGTFTDSVNRFRCTVRLPDLVIMLNTLLENGHEHMAVVESCKMCIPTVGIVDSNCDPTLITYPVPGNDDSYSSIQLYCKLFKKAILKGKSERKKHLQMAKDKEESTKVLEENENVSISEESQPNKV